MNRRQFLGYAAFAAGNLSACPRSLESAREPSLERASRAKKVIVIGAGLAGLVAGYELIQAGYDVVIFEARAWAGGRVHTLREPFSDGLYAEAGAVFIPNNHRLTLTYIRLFNLPIQPSMPLAATRLFYVRGRRIVPDPHDNAAWPFELTPEESQLGYPGIWQKYIGTALKALGDVSAPGWPSDPQLENYDRMSMAEFLRSQGASPGAVALLRLGYLDLTGDGIESYSALHMLRDLALRENERQRYSIRGGNDLLPKAFAARMAGKIRYNAPVVRIEPGARSAIVVTKHPGEYERLQADRVICAVPFSVLRQIEISPPLPAAKRLAIEQLRYTSVARVYFQSRRRVWLDENPYVTVTTDLPIMWLFDHAVNQPGPRGILEAQAAGPRARSITRMTESDRISFALEQTEKIFAGIHGDFERGVSKCWDEDPWARGAFAYFRPGQMQSLVPYIARPEGRVHFAGEHTSPWPGWMQGALESGLRVAREITGADEA